jgi:hypothetical protein
MDNEKINLHPSPEQKEAGKSEVKEYVNKLAEKEFSDEMKAVIEGKKAIINNDKTVIK